jgi:glycosyltransferase involved in cell wall biosynthesis
MRKKIILIYAWLFPSYPLNNGFNINEREKVKALINNNFEIKWIQGMGAKISDYPDFFKQHLEIIPTLNLKREFKILEYLHFWFNLFRLTYSSKKKYEPIMIFVGPDLVLPGLFLKVLFRLPLVSYLCDSWLPYKRKELQKTFLKYYAIILLESLAKLADKIILVNDKEASYLSGNGFDKKKIVVDHLSSVNIKKELIENRKNIRDQLIKELKIDSQCKIVFFHGLPNIISNVLAFNEICNNIAPQVEKIDNRIIFILAGGNLSQIGINDKGKNLISVGYIENREKIISYLISADLYVLPIEIGSGVKTKLLDAMNARIPILTTKFIQEEFVGEPPFILSKIDEFPTRIVESIYDESLLKSIREKTSLYINNYDNSMHVSLIESINDLIKHWT